MTQEEIIEMARQAGFGIGLDDLIIYAAHERFAKLVAQHERERIKQANAPEIERINAHIQKLEDAILAEREACAKVCENWTQTPETTGMELALCATAIRARGQA
jgi:hypothetical protein